MAENTEARQERERFHDRAYEEDVRAPVREYYSVVC